MTEIADAKAESQDDVARATEYLQTVFEQMGLDLDVSIAADGRYLRISLDGNDVDELVTGHGAAAQSDILEALQLLIARTIYQGNSGRTVVIDAGGFREERCELLSGAADRLAEFSARHEAVRVFGMNAFDRRAVHIQLKGKDGVSTDSEGQGVLRTLLVSTTQAGDSDDSDED